MAIRGHTWHRDETGVRSCSRCKQTKSVDDFNWLNQVENLKQYLCKDCQREQMRDRYANNRERVKVINKVAQLNAREHAREFVYRFLLAHSCMDCGENDVLVLTFDHVRGKKDNISDMVNRGYSVERIKDEIHKCEVVCLNCHMLRESKRRNSFKWLRGKND